MQTYIYVYIYISLSCQALGDYDAGQHDEGDDEMAGEDAELDEETKARLDLLHLL